MNITHIGHTTLRTPSSQVHVKNILCVPNAHKSLVSVHQLTRDNNAYIEFYPTHFSLKDQSTKKTLLQGRCEEGLYPLLSSSRSSPNKEANGAVKSSESLWHHRLGHASLPIVRQVLSRNNISFVKESNNHVCNPCQQGKCHQLPYPRSTSVSASPLDLIFSDVWGPAPASVGRNQYYLSFIDDHNKFVWVYLLRHKSQVFQCFQDFQQLVERKFDQKIKAIQTDWGGEYQALSTFFKRVGITHLVSCPHAHQQNGSAERKHRHIVEVGLSLLAHSSMPLKFWDYAFLTAVFLINRLPSKVIDNNTPYFRLLGQQPDYNTLRSFGCACWPNLRPFNARKLEYRSKQCVFLGYSTQHKGYKCLDPSQGRVYVSRVPLCLMKKFSLLHPCILTLVRDLELNSAFYLIFS